MLRTSVRAHVRRTKRGRTMVRKHRRSVAEGLRGYFSRRRLRAAQKAKEIADIEEQRSRAEFSRSKAREYRESHPSALRKLGRFVVSSKTPEERAAARAERHERRVEKQEIRRSRSEARTQKHLEAVEKYRAKAAKAEARASAIASGQGGLFGSFRRPRVPEEKPLLPSAPPEGATR